MLSNRRWKKSEQEGKKVLDIFTMQSSLKVHCWTRNRRRRISSRLSFQSLLFHLKNFRRYIHAYSYNSLFILTIWYSGEKKIVRSLRLSWQLFVVFRDAESWAPSQKNGSHSSSLKLVQGKYHFVLLNFCAIFGSGMLVNLWILGFT